MATVATVTYDETELRDVCTSLEQRSSRLHTLADECFERKQSQTGRAFRLAGNRIAALAAKHNEVLANLLRQDLDELEAKVRT